VSLRVIIHITTSSKFCHRLAGFAVLCSLVFGNHDYQFRLLRNEVAARPTNANASLTTVRPPFKHLALRACAFALRKEFCVRFTTGEGWEIYVGIDWI
jgi:hypothetical protein